MVKTYLFAHGEPWEEKEDDMTLEFELTLSIMKGNGKWVKNEEYVEQRF